MPIKIWVQPATLTIEWYFYIYTPSGYMSIDKNSVNEVYATITSNGSFTVSSGDTIDIYVNAIDFGNSVAASLSATDNGTLICNPNTCDFDTATVSCVGSFTVSGNGLIYGYADYC